MVDLAALRWLVHDAYAHLYDRAYLREHPLARLLVGESPNAAERLHRLLIDAIETVRPLGSSAHSSVEWRRYRSLSLRYVEGREPDEIARELCVSARQARRDHAEALDELARQLHRRLAATPSVADASPPQAVTGRQDELDAELAKLVASEGPATSVDETIAGVLQAVGALARRHGVSLRLELSEPIGAVEVTRTLLRQLLLELLNHAIIRHTGVTLTLSATGGEVPHVSLRAATGGQMVKPDTLVLAQRMASSQGVTVWIEEDGSAVHLQLPRHRAGTLLIVDDNPDVALLFRRYLSDTGYRIVQARSGERAVRLARDLLPTAVILDVLMPLTDGWEILQALRDDPATARLPVVICSVLPDEELARSLGATGFLPKPVTRAALIDALAALRQERLFEPAQAPLESSASAPRSEPHPVR